jgi:ABC-type enterobactin transport system permease subunit
MSHAVAAHRPRVTVRVRLAWTIAVFGTIAFLACLLAPLVGSTPIHLSTVFDRSTPYADNIDAQIFWVARLPRVLAAACFRRCSVIRLHRPIRLASPLVHRWER